MSKLPPPALPASANGPYPTIIQFVGRPGTGSLPSTIAPPPGRVCVYVCLRAHLCVCVVVVVSNCNRKCTRDPEKSYINGGWPAYVSPMLQQLQWLTHHERRAQAKIYMMYRMVYRLVDVPASHLTPTISVRNHNMIILIPYAITLSYK